MISTGEHPFFCLFLCSTTNSCSLTTNLQLIIKNGNDHIFLVLQLRANPQWQILRGRLSLTWDGIAAATGYLNCRIPKNGDNFLSKAIENTFLLQSHHIGYTFKLRLHNTDIPKLQLSKNFLNKKPRIHQDSLIPNILLHFLVGKHNHYRFDPIIYVFSHLLTEIVITWGTYVAGCLTERLVTIGKKAFFEKLERQFGNELMLQWITVIIAARIPKLCSLLCSNYLGISLPLDGQPGGIENDLIPPLNQLQSRHHGINPAANNRNLLDLGGILAYRNNLTTDIRWAIGQGKLGITLPIVMEYMLIAHVLLFQPETPLTVDVGVLGGGGGAAW